MILFATKKSFLKNQRFLLTDLIVLCYTETAELKPLMLRLRNKRPELT